MTTKVEELKARLLAMGVTNFNVFPGSDPSATPEQIAGEIIKALDEIEKYSKCPACASGDYNQKHHPGDWQTPACSWWKCDDCGHQTQPE